MNGPAAVDEDRNTKLGPFCVELRTSSKYSFRLAVGGERPPLAMASPKPVETAKTTTERETSIGRVLRPRLPEFFKAQQLLDDHKNKRAFAEAIQSRERNAPPQHYSDVADWIEDLNPEICVEPETAFPFPENSNRSWSQPSLSNPSALPQRGRIPPAQSYPLAILQDAANGGTSYLNEDPFASGITSKMRIPIDGDYAGDEERALRGNFIPVTKSLRSRSPFGDPSHSRARSPSRPSRSSIDSRFNLSLTESHMDKITVALSQDAITQAAHQEQMRGRREAADEAEAAKRRARKQSPSPKKSSMRSRSPMKADGTAVNHSRARSRSPVKYLNYDGPESRQARFEFRDSTTIGSPSEKQELRSAMKQFTTPVHHSTSNRHRTPASQPYESPILHRGPKGPPPMINLDNARHYSKTPVYVKQSEHTFVQQSPERGDSPAVRFADEEEEPLSSLYSQEEKHARYPSHVSPLRVMKGGSPLKPVTKPVTVLGTNSTWQKGSGITQSTSERALLSRSRGDTTATAHSSFDTHGNSFSPLASLISNENEKPTARKASKTLIGQNGWLESTSGPAPPKQTTSPVRKTGFFDSIMKKAKEMMSTEPADAKPQRNSHKSEKSQASTRSLAISLNPREQALLYCELEFALTSAINDYLVSQFNAGRLDADKLKKTAEAWQQKGRPKVVSFRYDLETQLDLVRLHVNDFKFYGRAATSTAILGIIDMMKVDARSLRVRTFCQPDTVVAKQLLDSQNLFNCIGCPETQQLQLAEITGFFKAAMERERVLAKRDSQRVSQHEAQHEATNNLSLRHAKSHSGQSWNKGTGTGTVKRRCSAGAMKMDPSSYDDSMF
ncbi:hypothetical protein B0T14DRAFT_569636 [Immersiella caudata]|uniref:Uncharacterized protein n=1 Tax=Immersiella caudata TaxID=314043 RepID=A0AA39WDX3_9PEZI|nr:hypothetical protein B0T14DRAFT_569636 [Immersiella caudata]